MRWLHHQLNTPIDPASLIVFRICFGLLATAAAVRFVVYGWVDQLLVEPSFYFSWIPGLPVASAPVLYGIFALQAVAGLGIALGRHTRLCLLMWLVAFGYVELIDKSLYLNHYVLFTLLGITLCCAPIHRLQWNDGSSIHAWVVWLLRIEIGLVYLWAGIAKLNADWLIRAEPLTTWLQAKIDTPLFGPLLAHDWTAFAFSWGGMAYDISIPFLLLMKQTRRVAVALVLFFHVTVGLLFPIGIFPILMMIGACLFLTPSWPRRWLGPRFRRFTEPSPGSRWGTLVWVAVVTLVALTPGRHMIRSGNVNWTEDGYRFSWRVLLNEKTGFVDFIVIDPTANKSWRVYPADELTELQHHQMRTQPDMIREYALHLQRQQRLQGRRVEVHVDSWVSLNGRRAQRFIRSDIDITQSQTTLNQADWILPLDVQ